MMKFIYATLIVAVLFVTGAIWTPSRVLAQGCGSTCQGCSPPDCLGVMCSCGDMYCWGCNCGAASQNSDGSWVCGSPTSCFLPGTEIKTPTSTKKIEDFVKGDIVESYDPVTQKIVQNTVTGLDTVIRDHYYQVQTASGKTVKTTDEHPFYVGFSGLSSKSTSEKIMGLVNITSIYLKDGLEVIKVNLRSVL